MSFLQPIRALTAGQRRTFGACFLAWTLDASDFFILTFCLKTIAADFHVTPTTVTKSLFWTLAMRPVGALLFGMLAEKIGRKPTLILNVLCFTLFGIASAFAPSFGAFLVLRAMFGVAMGGEWGVGAALAFETLPASGRGFFSGLLQEGYVTGHLVAAALFGLLFSHLHGTGFATNWRVMFLVSALPSLLVVGLLLTVKESPIWLAAKQGKVAAAGVSAPASGGLASLVHHVPLLLMMILLMTTFASFSHGTQDLYPTFLQRDHGLSPGTTSWVAIAGDVGAFLGGISFGALSERWGRRRAIMTAALLAIPMIPLWSWSHTAAMLACGGLLMQFMVQGAWGVVPAYLNEMSPGPVRAIVPGLTYQLGNLIASWNSHLQESAAKTYYSERLGPVLGWTVLIVAVCMAVIASLARERRGMDLETA